MEEIIDGVKVPVVNKISKGIFKHIENELKSQVFDLS